MAEFNINILGCGSALPTTRHLATSQIVDLRDKLYMIDCGEGTQVQMRRMRVRFGRLAHIFISHLHGDHCFGLPGLISTLGMLGRTGELVVHGPKEVETYLRPVMDLFCRGMEFEVRFNPVDTRSHSLVMEDGLLHPAEAPDSHLRLSLCRETEGGAYHPRDDGFLSGSRPLHERYQAGAGLCHARRRGRSQFPPDASGYSSQALCVLFRYGL